MPERRGSLEDMGLPEGVSPKDIRRLLDRILRSRAFAQSNRMSRFLSYVVAEALAGDGNRIKEYSIGLEVFDKPQDFDPRTDPIVRVEARRLRAKLLSYYGQEGRDEPFRIEMPKGHYAPLFVKVSTRTPTHPVENTIAVLPFGNLSSELESEYYSDGLAEELIHAVTKVAGIQVVAWSSTAQFRGPDRDLKRIGEQLHVRYVLEGSVRRQGDCLRVMVQLIDARNGHYLLSESYDCSVLDLFSVQNEIARAVAGALRVRLIGAVQHSAIGDVDAYNLYLLGRYYWNKRSRENMERGAGYFRQALERDEKFALAHAGLADFYTLMALDGMSRPMEVVPLASSAAQRALELDPTLAESHTSLALLRSHYAWNWEKSEGHYRRAIELNPAYATAHHWYAIHFLALRGRFDEAFRELELARRFDPLSLSGRESEGYILMLARRYQEAVAAYRRLMAGEPEFYKAHTGLGRVYLQIGQYDMAIECFRRGRELGGTVPNILGALGQAYGLAGRRDEARQLLRDLEGISRSQPVTCSCFALIHLGLGERAKALDWLEKGCRRRELTSAVFKIHPAYDVLRSEPRFAAILGNIGLA